MSLITLDCSRLLCFLRFKPQAIHKAFALTGRFVDCYYTQGVALGYELLPFQGVLLMSIALGYELLPFQGVLLMSIALGYGLLPFQGVLLMSIALGYELLPFQGVLLVSIALGYELLPFTFAFPFGQRFSIPLRASDCWFRACCLFTLQTLVKFT